MSQLTRVASESAVYPERLRALQRLGVVCGIAAGAWLGAAEVPTKLVSSGLSPFLISLMMVVGLAKAACSNGQMCVRAESDDSPG